MRQRVERDVEPEGLEARAFEHQVLDQEALAAAYVEDAHARLQPEMRDDVARDAAPAAVIAVAAVAIFARPVPVHLPEFARLADHPAPLPFPPLLTSPPPPLHP